MTKIMALDLGDQWVGTALSDKTRMFASPYKTIKLQDLYNFLKEILKNEKIEILVIGYPLTLKGQESIQTKKIIVQKENLEKTFPEIKFVLWDERLSSKRAENLKASKSKEDKIKSHSIAAAFILDTYLNFLTNINNSQLTD